MADLIVGILATWRLCKLLLDEDGPGEILARFRDRIGVRFDEQSRCYGVNDLAKLFCCIWCLSVWVGFLVARGNLINGFAYSGGAILVNKVVERYG